MSDDVWVVLIFCTKFWDEWGKQVNTVYEYYSTHCFPLFRGHKIEGQTPHFWPFAYRGHLSRGSSGCGCTARYASSWGIWSILLSIFMDIWWYMGQPLSPGQLRKREEPSFTPKATSLMSPNWHKWPLEELSLAEPLVTFMGFMGVWSSCV